MRQFKVNDELINKIKKLISNDDKDKLITNLEELHYADLAEIFESLEIIEVQSGTYLGEDDIVRFDDIYGRK